MKKYVVSLPQGENIESSIDLWKLQPDLSVQGWHPKDSVGRGGNVLNPGPQGAVAGTPAGSWETWVLAFDFHFPLLGFSFLIGLDFYILYKKYTLYSVQMLSDAMTSLVESHFLGTWAFPSV